MKKNWFLYSGIIALIYFIFIHNLGFPALLDSDETRYADMARDMLNSGNYLTLYLDNKIFWDKPPLFFWALTLSYKIFGISEFSVRIPSVLAALSSILGIFFAVKKAISSKVAILSTIILATTVEFIIFARVSILDMILCANITLSLLCSFMTYFVQEKNKKYLWWLFYIFSAFGLLTKGIPAVVVPFGTMFFVGIWKRNLNDFFKPQYFVIGSLLFLMISFPWHILMYKIHGMEFINEYIIKHHIQRFIGSEEIGRQHSMLYYIPTFIVGFLPWTMSFIFGLKKLFSEKKNYFITMNLIGLIFTFVFFSVSSTKLITYILPIYPMAAVLCSYIWINSKYNNEIKLSIKFTNFAFILFAVLVSLAGLYLPYEIYTIIKPLQIYVVIAFLLAGVWFKKRQAFIAYVLLVIFLASYILPHSLNIWYEFGQKELMQYAQYAKENHLQLCAYNIWERFSLQYYYGGDIEYFSNGESYGTKYVQTTNYNGSFNSKPIVVTNEDLDKLNTKYNFILKGKRYSLIKEKYD